MSKVKTSGWSQFLLSQIQFDYPVRNEQYSRKNNIRLLGLEEQPSENLETKFNNCMQENLGKEVKPEEIEIIHRIASRSPADCDDQRSTQSTKPRAVIIKLVLNKTTMGLLVKRRQLKGKRLVIVEDMTQHLAKRLKAIKEKRSVESAWFTTSEIKYKLKNDTRVMGLKGWIDLSHIGQVLIVFSMLTYVEQSLHKCSYSV